MDSGMEIIIFLSYAAGLLGIFILAKIFSFSSKVIKKIVVNSICGGIAIILVNILGECLGVHLPLNIISAFGVGTLGVPGIILFYLFCYK
jgi:inhibitor of the pro-sigma K processing machinery